MTCTEKQNLQIYRILQMMYFTCMHIYLNPFTPCNTGLRNPLEVRNNSMKKYQRNTGSSTSHNQGEISTKFSKKQELGVEGKTYSPSLLQSLALSQHQLLEKGVKIECESYFSTCCLFGKESKGCFIYIFSFFFPF